MQETPRISIVTVCRNAEYFLESTLQSIANQTSRPFQYIVIDGDSSDHSIQIIERYRQHVDILISEPDRGIYDAMNKATRLATGDYILFMNAGDLFVSNSTLSMVETLINGSDLVYGDHFVAYPDGYKRLQPSKNHFHDIWKGMICSHQSLFAKTGLLRNNPFSLSCSAADFEFIFRSINQACSVQRLNFPVATITSGGISDRKRFRSMLERWSIVGRTRPIFSTHLYYSGIILDNFLRSTIKGVLPLSIVQLLTRAKYIFSNKAMKDLKTHEP